ncbi:alpha/beta fold hydrolase [Ammoniphilus sp. YIM 78166]|uniref:alpha/beta fold hydrolase n=1 Tax=Ammoniphilus sp. YIM 78166 TaxID=1644106 RepID=UPI001431909F|nr:alpha/beta hydrolase [Ammoniphilus sp. YIM 78166]
MSKELVNGFQMAYEKLGDGNRTLLLIHGNLGSKRWWNLVKEELAQRYTVYSVDLRGCGESEKPNHGYSLPQYGDDVLAFMDLKGIRSCSVIGHSMGGAIAVDLASKAGDRIEKMLLLNPAPIYGYVTSDEKYDMIKRYSTDRELLQAALSAVVPKGAHLPLFADLVEDAWSSTHTAISNARSLGVMDYREAARRIEQPVSILFGEQDVLISLEDMKKMQSYFPHGELVTHHEVGHSPQVEDPEWFLRETLAFLER